MKRLIRAIVTVSVLMVVAPDGVLASEPVLPVFVSVLPQKYIVEQIGQQKVDVNVMVAPGASPATYEPKPAQMAALSKTRLYFAIGVPFENFWLDKIAASNPAMQLIHTDAGIRKRPMAAHHHNGEHDHGTAHDDHDMHKAETPDRHGHEGMDPHIWTSPVLVKQQAQTICNALAANDPDNTTFYTRNLERFLQETDRLNTELHELFKDKQGTRFMVFHPSWGYFAREYGLEMIPIEVEGKDPKPAQLMALIKSAREHGIHVLFVQPQFSAKSARLIAREIKGRVVTADPLAPDWAQNLKTIAQAFKEALK